MREIKGTKYIVLLLLIVVIIGMLALGCANSAVANESVVDLKTSHGMQKAETSSKALTTHSPIIISDNTQFTTANGVVSGSGTQADPYVIENWDINASSANGIDIQNADVFFIIRNCDIHGGESSCPGLYFYSVANGKIENVTAYNNYIGIFLDHSSNNNQITNCCVYNNSVHGVRLGSSTSNKITNCTVYNHLNNGIYVSDGSNGNVIANCTVYNNYQNGINLWKSSSNLIWNNYFRNVDNAYNYVGYVNKWNTTKTLGTNTVKGPYIGGNYWSNYTGTDTNGDGLGDTPYNITGGGSGMQDELPLVADTTKPAVTNVAANPNPQEVCGYVNITCAVTDNYGGANYGGVNVVKVNTTYPNGEVTNISMIKIIDSNNYYYNMTCLVSGTYSYYIWANDTSNNQNKSSGYTFMIYDPPTNLTITINSGAQFTNLTQVMLALSAQNASEMCFSNNNSTWSQWESFTTTKLWNLTGDGEKKVFFKCKHVYGAESRIVFDAIILDTTSPQTQIYPINPSAPYVTGVPFTVSWGGTDTTSGIQHYDIEYKVGFGSGWQSLAYHTIDTSANFYALSEGQTAYFRCRATDNAGNVEDWPTSNEGYVNVTVDCTPPTTSHILSGSMGSNSWYISNVEITLSASDGVSGMNYTEYRINNGAWTIYTDTFTLEDDETHILYYRSVDKAGNTESTKSNTVKIDKASPITTPSLSGTMSNNEWFVSTVEVSLSAGDYTSGVDVIKYSWDTTFYTYSPCSKPNKEIDGVYTIFYYAVDLAGNQGTTDSLSFKIDKTAPTTSYSVVGTQCNSDWYISDVTIMLTGTDTASKISQTYYQINNGVTQSGTSIALTQSGTYIVKYWSVDNAGNSEQDASITIKIDKDKPIISLGSPAEGEIVTTNTPFLSWSGSDDASQISYYEVQVDNNNNFASPEFTKTTADTSTATISLPDGSYYWRVRAVDNAGNIGDWGGSMFTISTGPPTDLSVKINNGAQFTNSTHVSLILDASQNAYEMCFSNNNVSWFAWEPFVITKAWLLTAGDEEKKVYFKCRNLYGDESWVVNDIIILDMTSPTTCDNVLSGWQVEKPITVTLNAIDNTSGIAYTYYKVWLAGTTEPDWSEGAEATIIAEGVWYVKYYSVDVAGNAEINKSKEIWIDTATPTTTDNIPSGWVNTTVTVNLTPSDATSGVARTYYKFWVTANAEPSEYTEGTVILVSTDGKWYIKYYSVDIANNSETPKQKELWLDATLPSLQITEPQDGLITNKENITVKGTVSDLNEIESADILVNDCSYFIALVDGNFSQVVKLSNGTNIIILKAKDPAQNQAEISITITYDPTIPTLVIYTPTNNSITNISQCTVSGETEPEYTITVCGTNTSVNDSGRFARTVILTEGLNIINVTATNPAGTKMTVFVYIMLDTIVPITAHDIAGDQGSNNWYVSDVAITLNATDSTTTVIQTRYRINNGSWLDYTASFTIITDSVCYTIEYYSVDTAGNVEAVKSFYFKLDKTPPITIHDLIGTEGANGWYNSTVTLILTASDGTSNIASIKYRNNNDSWLDYLQAPIFSDGEYFIEYYSIDCAGNHEEIKNVLFKTDTTSPDSPKNITISPTAWTNINSFSIDWNNPGDIAGIAGSWYKIGSRPIHNQDGTFTYQKPLVVSAPADGSYAVYVWLQDKAGNANYQFSATAYIKLDTTIPQTTLLKTGTSGNENWYISEVTVEFSVLDVDSGLKATYYSFENSEYQLYTSAFNITEDGIYSIKYYSIDNAGNTELETTVNIKIDKKNPTTNATKEGVFGNADWFTSNVTVVLKSYDETSGISTCYWSINNTDYQQYTAQIILSQEGAHTIRYYSTDTAGNIESEKELFVRIDKTSPTTTVLIQGLLGNDDWYVTPLTFSLISQDTVSGIKKTEYEINQGIWEEYTVPITFQDGIYTINYFAVNNADIQEELQSIVIKVDHTSPITNISAIRYSVKGEEVLFANSTIKFFAEDDTSGVKEIKYCINNSVWMSYCEPIFLEEGIYTIQYYSIDFAGNTEYSNTKTIIIGEKMLVPIVEITYPMEIAELSDNVSVSYTACSILNKTLLIAVKFLHNAGEIIIAENITPEDEVNFSTARMENGVYTLRIIAVDSDGRMGYKEINVSVNNKMILEISVPSGIVPNSVVQITAEICNYLRGNECFAAEFYFDDLYIGCNQTSILKIFEKEKLSLSYKVNSTTEHCISVKLFTKNRQLLEEKKIYFTVASIAEEQSNEQAGFNFLQFSIPVFMCACFGILYISRKRRISSWKVPPLKRTSSSCSILCNRKGISRNSASGANIAEYKPSQLPYSSNPLKSPEEVQRMIAEYKNKLRGEKNE